MPTAWMLGRGVAVLLGAAMVSPLALAAPPKVDFFFPAGGQQGQTVSVTAAGSFSAWPAKAWVDRAGLTVEAGEKKGELKIAIAPEAGGVYWLRLYDDEGAAALRPFVVGALPEVNEVETNDDPQQPQLLPGAAVVNGKLAKRGDVDGYAIELTQGQTLVASLLANETLGSPLDGVLQVCTPEGFVLAQNDDGRGRDPLLTYRARRDGTHLVRVFAFPAEPNSSIAFAGGENFVYRLTVTTEPFVDYALPLAVRADEPTELRLFGWNLAEETATVAAPSEAQGPGAAAPPASPDWDAAALSPNLPAPLALPVVTHALVTATDDNSPQAPQAAPLPAVVSGVIETPKDSDAFRFAARKGQKLSLRVEARALGSPLDGLLEVRDAEGKSLAEADDTGREDRDPSLAFTAPADGEFLAVVRDVHFHGGLRYAYRLTIEEETPDFRLTLPADAFALSPGKPLELTVNVERRHGFAGEIEIRAEGLPAGVSASPVTSPGAGNAAKSVKVTLTAESPVASGPFRVVGRAATGPARTARFNLPPSNLPHTQAWLTATRPN